MMHPIPDAALDSDIAIIARKGSGKSYLARGLAERLLDLKRRLLVIDPLGAWWGLRSSASGQDEGYPVAVFGGEHGDMPLTDTMGEPLARLIAGENLPCVIDTSLMRKEEQGRLAIDLFEGLFRHNKEALTIILEEADVFAPQNPAKDRYAAQVLHEVDRIARRGRARGLRLISLTQRPARLHKDVLSQAATLVAMRLSAPQDRDAIKAWVEGNADRDQSREVMDSLVSLAVGEGWVWAPDLGLLSRAKFPRIKTLDTSATPKAGERRVEPKTLAQVDVEALRGAIEAQAKEEARQAPARGASKADIDAAEKRGYDRGFTAGIVRGETDLLAKVKRIVNSVLENEILTPVPVSQHAAIEHSSPPFHLMTPATQKAVNAVAAQAVKQLKRSVTSASKTEASPVSSYGMDRLLAAMDTSPARRISWPAIAIRAGYAESGGGFRKAKKQLLESGRALDGDGGPVAAERTGSGTVPTRDQLVALWQGKLDTGATTLLGVLHRAGGSLSISDLASGGGYAESGGGFRKALKQLRSTGLVENAEQRSIAFSRAFLEAAGE